MCRCLGASFLVCVGLGRWLRLGLRLLFLTAFEGIWRRFRSSEAMGPSLLSELMSSVCPWFDFVAGHEMDHLGESDGKLGQ